MFDKLEEEFNITEKDFPEKYTEFCTGNKLIYEAYSIWLGNKICVSESIKEISS